MAHSRLLMTPGVAKEGQSGYKEEIAFLCTVTSDQPDKSWLVRSYSGAANSRAVCEAEPLELLRYVFYLVKLQKDEKKLPERNRILELGELK